LTISVHARCPACRIDRTRILLDGIEIPGSTPITPRTCGLPAASQEHLVHVVMDLSTPCGLFDSPRSSVRLESRYMVTIDGPAIVDIEAIDDGGATSAFGDHVNIRWVASGLEGAVEAAQPVPASCLSLDAARCAECRALARRDDAVRRRDVVEAICIDAKLAAIRSAISRADGGDLRATATILRSEREASGCQGEGPYLMLHTEVLETSDCGEAPREPRHYWRL
jgi:hypothetical protein